MMRGRPAAWRRRARITLVAAAVAAVLAAVFMAYLAPSLAVDLATRLWACF